MKFKLFGRSFEIKASTSTLAALQSDAGWVSYLSARGYAVSADTALQISAVFRCVDLVSKTIATLPLHLLKNTDKGKEKASDHTIYQLVHMSPNYQTTAFEFVQMYLANLMLTRGAFAKIQRNSRGYITALWNLPTSRVGGIYVNSVNGERFIVVTGDAGSQETLREGEFMYTPGFLFGDRNVPNDPMVIAGEVLGLTNTLKDYAKQAVNAVNPGGFVEVPGQLSQPAFTRFKEDFNANYKGAVNAGNFLFLEEGAKAQMFERDMEKMQVLESRKHSVIEICRIWGVPPHLVMELDRSTFNNIEQQNLEFVTYCIAPMIVKLEQTLFMSLLTDTEKSVFFFKFNLNGLLRGDTQTRASFYNTLRQTGCISANEVRRLEDMDEYPEESGADDLHVNGNLITLANARANIPKGAQSAQKGATP